MNKNQGGRRTKLLISLALYQLMFKYEYDDISVKDICDKARISRMSFYRYFTCKDDIFINYCDERFEEFYNDVFSKPNLNIEEFITSLFTFVKKYSRQINILVKAHKEQLLSSQFINYANYIITTSKKNYGDNFKANYLLAAFFAGGLFNAIMAWIQGGLRESPEDMTHIFRNLMSLNEAS